MRARIYEVRRVQEPEGPDGWTIFVNARPVVRFRNAEDAHYFARSLADDARAYASVVSRYVH